MKRKEWGFKYFAKHLSEAAALKRDHHKDRLEWWKAKQTEVVADIREKGLEVTDSISSEYLTSSSLVGGAFNRGAQIVVKDDYQEKLNECHMKIREHDAKRKEYDQWVQVLEANSANQVEIDADDFAFFFGI